MKCSKGNALFLILIAVALFAALSYAVTQSGRGSGGIDKEQALLDASRLIQYVGEIEQAINRMMLINDVAAADIKFYNTKFFTAITARCSTGEDCVWAEEGGGVEWTTEHGSNQVHDIRTIPGIGTAAAELIVIGIAGISEAMCRELNKNYDITGIPLSTGSIAAPNAPVSERTACFKHNATGTWFFFHVVVEN